MRQARLAAVKAAAEYGTQIPMPSGPGDGGGRSLSTWSARRCRARGELVRTPAKQDRRPVVARTATTGQTVTAADSAATRLGVRQDRGIRDLLDKPPHQGLAVTTWRTSSQVKR